MARFIATNAMQLVLDRYDLDPKRLSDNLPKTNTKKIASEKICDGLELHAKEIRSFYWLMQAAEFKGTYSQKCLEDLDLVYHLITDSLKNRLSQRDIVGLRDLVKPELMRVIKEADRIINPPVNWNLDPQDGATFRILLLTDFHWGAKGCDARWNNVQQPFFNALAKACRNGKKFDLAIFSGDLAYSGHWNEYDQAPGLKGFNGFLRNLWRHLGDNCGGCPLLLAVPGNHDAKRVPDPVAFKKFIKDYFNYGSVWKKFWVDNDKETVSLFKNAFADYAKWSGFNLDLQAEDQRLRREDYRKGLITGDFSYRFRKPGGRHVLGIIGLNSAFLQLTDGDYDGWVALEDRQIQAICPNTPRAWMADNDANILVTHHPSIWLHESCQKNFIQNINIPDVVDAHLHGHLHDAAYRAISHQPGNIAKSIQGIALCGSDTFYDSQNKRTEKRMFGYVIVEIRVTPSSNFIRFRPRRITEYGTSLRNRDRK